ncbi:MAG: septum formation initiator family protein [Candidatus Kapabacteria bacterium]|nr:septum formation initiator family protein [Candidatus Kapabacteria bacterium]
MAKTSANTLQQRVMTRKRLITIIVLTAAVLAFALFSNYGLLTRLTLMSETETLEGHLGALRATSDSLRRQIRVLETDRTEIERLARERYGYVRPDEEVFIINRDSTEP